MRESLISEGASKREEREEIREGIAAYLDSPFEDNVTLSELREIFEKQEAESPLSKEEFAKEVEQYIGKNLTKLLPFIVGAKDNSDLLAQLKLTNEDIGLLGANAQINKVEGKFSISRLNERDSWSSDSGPLTTVEILALACAKDMLRVDSSRRVGKKNTKIAHRYYLKEKKRYLATNDFGMRVYSPEAGKMVEGDVTNANPFIETAKKEIERISGNLQSIVAPIFNKKYGELTSDIKPPEGITTTEQWTEYNIKEQSARRQAEEATNRELVSNLNRNPKEKQIVLTAVSQEQAGTTRISNIQNIIRKYHFVGKNPVKDYERFIDDPGVLDELFSEPSADEKDGISFDFIHSTVYKRPIILADKLDQDRILEKIRSGVREALATRAAENDPELKEAFTTFRCGRGPQSPYSYPDDKIYDFLKAVEPESAKLILASDDRNIFEQMEGLEFLRAMDFDIGRMKPDEVKKQLHQAYTLKRSNLWRYLAERNLPIKSEIRWGKESDLNVLEQLAALGFRKARSLFNEGKRMYWLAKQVHMQLPNRTETDRFYKSDFSVDWTTFDISKIDIDEAQLEKHLAENKTLIAALLTNSFRSGDQWSRAGEGTEKSRQPTLSSILGALEKGQDIRGVAIANDKQRYLEGVIAGTIKDDLEFALADWPPEWRAAITVEEINLYYEYARDYVTLDPDGLRKYAQWRASEEGKQWGSVFKDAPQKKADLDFRICLGNQTPEIRGWYKTSAEYVGGLTLQEYLLRFNATRDGNGQLANWHDILLWSPNIQKLEPGEAKAVLSGITTMDENQEFIRLLPRYDRARDKMRQAGPIQSIRELAKRIIAIESGIDIADLPPAVQEITSAPGFDLASLQRMRNRADFANLIEGKLDANQPFKPHSRIFAGRALTEALREGLGSQRQKIRGTAHDPKGLFHSLKQLIKDKKIGEEKMQVTDLFESVPIELEQEVIKLLQDQRVDIGPLVEATVHAKSDPEGWVCGNYTDCCMPFGATNNDDYMFNPSTQYFTVKYNGRIIAQSVVINGIDNRDNSDVVILDNIEVANNYKNLSPLLSRVYTTFWTEFTSKPVKVGSGYADLIPSGSRLEVNNFKSKTRLSYSDARGSQIYNLPKISGLESMDEIMTFANLTEGDAELIARIEKEAYPDGMVQGKTHIAEILQKQRELEVPGAAASFLIRQGEELAGYLLILPEASEVNPGEQAAHVYDMAVLPKFRGTPIARRMMERVLDTASAYGVPIEAEARASTSYPLLMNRRIRSWFESKGFYLTKNEKLPAYLNGEDFYFVRFENRQNAEETV